MPGSGKSTLISALVAELRGRGKTIAVAAIDPSSPFSGGAVLADRCRMSRHQGDSGVYIRSLSARGCVGGLSAGTGRVVEVLKAAAFDLVLIESVGAGQSEVDIRDIAKVCVVVCTPNSGDDVQAIKSGILEIADILVVNKSDLADAGRAVQQLTEAQNLPSNAWRRVPVLPTVATDASGIAVLADRILEQIDTTDGAPGNRNHTNRIRRRLVRAISQKLEQRLLDSDDEYLVKLCTRVLRGQQSFEDAAAAWVADKKL